MSILIKASFSKSKFFSGTQFLLSACLASALLMASCGGSGGGTPQPPVGGPPPPPPPPPPLPPPPPPPPPPSGVFATEAQTSRFLGKATFGATQTQIDGLTGTEVSDWVRAEFDKPVTHYLPVILNELAAQPQDEMLPPRRISDAFLEAAIIGDDQLRQRMVLALSEIIVVSYNGQLQNFPATVADYMDVLSDNAFGNYRDLLEEVTYTPAMGFYLTYVANQKGDPDTGRVPDENYARELMQLFTLGLTELNLDGSEKLDGTGQPIEIFDNSDVTGLAKVFTGLSWDSGNFFNFRNDPTSTYRPLVIYPEQHSDLEKTFLTVTIPPGTGGEASIDMALDEIFAHPNMAPFVSRQLIQRFVSSNPDTAYVQRVATTFDAGTYTLPDGTAVGTGVRGDLKATLAAVLLDQDALRDPATAPAASGKIREPIIRFVNWARAFNVTTPDVRDEQFLANMSFMGQHPFRSPSVFNFFRPGFVAPNTETGAAGLTVPELQIINESSAMAYINFINAFIYDFSPNISGDEEGGVRADYGAEFTMADDAQALVDRLDLLLTGKSLGPATKTRLLEMMDEIPIRAGSEDEDRLTRVVVGVTMTMTAPGYLVQK